MSETKTKKKAAPEHPKYVDMIKEAVFSLKERKGSSRQAIKKYISANFNIPDDQVAKQVNLALKRGTTSGTFIMPNGPSGTVKVAKPEKKAEKAKKETKPKEKKPAAAASPKKVMKKKAAPAKPKAVEKKKASPKKAKSTTPKKATTKKASTKPAAKPKKAASTTEKTKRTRTAQKKGC